jgi:hypothetical protein
MATFKSDNDAKTIAENIAKTSQVHFTNEGLEILFTKDAKNQIEIIEDLKKVFSNAKLKGRKVPSIVINRVSKITNGIRITEVTY